MAKAPTKTLILLLKMHWPTNQPNGVEPEVRCEAEVGEVGAVVGEDSLVTRETKNSDSRARIDGINRTRENRQTTCRPSSHEVAHSVEVANGAVVHLEEPRSVWESRDESSW